MAHLFYLESSASFHITYEYYRLFFSQDYNGIFENIAKDIEKLRTIGMDIKAKTGDEKGAIERSLNEVQNEHKLLGTTMEDKKKACLLIDQNDSLLTYLKTKARIMNVDSSRH